MGGGRRGNKVGRERMKWGGGRGNQEGGWDQVGGVGIKWEVGESSGRLGNQVGGGIIKWDTGRRGNGVGGGGVN